MAKSTLHLTIDPELVNIAKDSGINLSSEFEEFIRFRLKQNIDTPEVLDIDLEKAKHIQALKVLETKAELQARQEMKDKEELMLIDHIIDNEMEGGTKPPEIAEKRGRGTAFLFKQRFNKTISTQEAVQLLNDRIKERELNGSN